MHFALLQDYLLKRFIIPVHWLLKSKLSIVCTIIIGLWFVAPQFGKSQLTVTPINSQCVILSWENPEFPGNSSVTYQVN